MLITFILEIYLKITNLRLQLHLPGTNDFVNNKTEPFFHKLLSISQIMTELVGRQTLCSWFGSIGVNSISQQFI